MTIVRRVTALIALLTFAATPWATPPAAVASDDGPETLEDKILDDIDEEIKKAGAAGGYTIELVGPDAKSIEPRRFLRGIPGQFAVSEFPRVFVIEGQPLFTAGAQPDARLEESTAAAVTIKTEADLDVGDAVHYRAASSASLPPGKYTIDPFGLAFETDGRALKLLHPALSADGTTLNVHVVPVTFAAADAATGRAVPLSGLKLFHGDTDLLENLIGAGPAAFNPLTIYLPRGTEYRSTLGDFRIDDAGKIIPGPGVAGFKNGTFIKKVATGATAKARPTGKGYWLTSHNGRRVFRRGEAGRFVVIASGDYPPADLPVVVKALDGAKAEHNVGRVALPNVSGADSRLFLLDTAALGPGKYEIAVEHADARGFAFEVVEVAAPHGLLRFTVDAVGESSFTSDADGFAELRKAGVQVWSRYGHGGMLPPGATIQSPYGAAPDDAPAELRRDVGPERLLLDESMRHGLATITYANRRAGWYNEGLAFHHSHPMSVQRMVRRVHVFGQELEDYPANAGMSYTWFPNLGGYVESGVPTDPFFGTRMEALRAKVKQDTGFEPLTADEWQQFRTLEGEGKRPLANKLRNYWRAEQRLGWLDHFTLYNSKLREVRSDFIATTAENAGHDGGKSLADLAGAHDAMTFESYTDFGDWPMSAGFVVDWGHGMAPGKPMWQQVDPGQSEPTIAAKQIIKFARGCEGIGVGVNAHTAAGKRGNAKRALTNRFLERCGSLLTAYEPDMTVAVCVNELQDRGLYHAHALHSHLTRLGYGPVILSERTVEQGVPVGVKVILIPNHTVPFSKEFDAKLAAFIGGGGKVVLVGEKSIPIRGATEVKVPLKHLWDVGGFPAHLPFWAEFKKVLPELERAMAAAGLKPHNGAAPEKALILPMRSGGMRYVAVVASPADTKDTEFNAVEAVAVKVGPALKVINLVTGEELPIKGDTVLVDLVSEPAALLALPDGQLREIELSHPAEASAGETIEVKAGLLWAGADARTPVEYVCRDAAGRARATFHRLAGEAVSYRIPATEPAGEWTVTATELVGGITATAKVKVAAAPAVNAVVTADAAYLPHPDRVTLFSARRGEVRVIVEDAQADVLPEAERVVTALQKAGRKAGVQRVGDASFDTLWMRWFPTKVEEKLLAKIDAGEVVGYRGNLEPYINKAKRAHVPQKGGWSDIDPPYVVRTDVVVFSGGKLAESLKAVSDWTGTPNTPGKGQGVIEVALSPFWADRHALAVVANEPAGRKLAVDRLVEVIANDGKIEPAKTFAPAKSLAPTAKVTGTRRTKLETPLKDFVPPALAERLAASAHGFAVVQTKKGAALISPAGELLRTLPCSDIPPTVVEGGKYFGAAIEVTQTHPGWHFPTAWKVAVQSAGAKGDGATFTLPQEVDWIGDRFRGWDGGYAVSPDGKTYFAGGPGGGYLLADLEKGTYRSFREPADAIGFYEKVRAPSFVSAARFSPDGRFVAFTVAHHPSGYGGMMGPPPHPFSTGVRLARVDTGEIVWRRDVEKMNDPSLAAAGEAFAVSNGLPGGAAGREGEAPAEPRSAARPSAKPQAFNTRDGFSGPAGAEEPLSAAQQEPRPPEDGLSPRVCFIDWNQHAVILGEGGKELFRKPLFDWKAKSDYRANPVPLRVETTPDASTVMFASDGNVLLTDGSGAEVASITVPAVSDVQLSADGARVYAADLDGAVTCFDRKGGKVWGIQTAGERPRLAATAKGLLVAEGAGNLLMVDAKGAVVRKTTFADVSAAGRWLPFKAMSGRPLYREPQTLDVLRKLAGARQVAGDAHGAGDAAGRKLRTTTDNVTVNAAVATAPGEQYLVRVAYKHGGKGVTVRLDNGRVRRTFTLDLPTPEYRVVDLPHEGGPSLNVFVAPLPGEEGLQVGEMSVHVFKFPGNNGLYIQPPDADLQRAEGLEVAGDDAEAGDPLEAGVLDDKDPAAVAGAASGKMKNAAIFANNPDPDQVEGRYLRATGNALDAFDGRRFDASGEPGSAWTNGVKGAFGSRVLIELPYVSRPKLCATYERTLKQSEVMKGLAVLRGRKGDFKSVGDDHGPDRLAFQRRALAGLIDNDQFFNVFALDGVEMDAFGVYVYSGRGKDHGLSEVELYE